MRWASQHVYELFLKNGVQIFEYTARTLHAKSITIDGIYSTIGSFNLDRLSWRHNLELSVSTIDPDTAAQLESHFEEDIQNAKEVTLKDLKERPIFSKILHWTFYHLMSLH